MNSKFTLPAKFILFPFYKAFQSLKYDVRLEGRELIENIKGPAILFANHTHTLDPFMISSMLPFHVRWVAGAYLFKLPFVSFLLRKWVTAIPKTQGRSDLETIRSINKALKENDVVGLFPEGTRTWDGDTLDITGGTAKLVRIFKSPVIFMNIQGGFANKPRWANKARKGPVIIKVTKVLSGEEIAKMSLPEINEVVRENLIFSHDKWISDNPKYEYKGPVAEGIERVLYACPKCKSISSMVSDENSVKCTKCGAAATVDSHYALSSDSIEFKQISSWYKWEKELVAEIFNSSSDNELLFPVDKGILFQKTTDNKHEVLSTKFTVGCYNNKLEFNFDNEVFGSKSLVFELKDIESLIINTKQTVEFYSDGQQYRFRPEGMLSSLKYQDLYLEYKKSKEVE